VSRQRRAPPRQWLKHALSQHVLLLLLLLLLLLAVLLL
jgi:hypothetical protein